MESEVDCCRFLHVAALNEGAIFVQESNKPYSFNLTHRLQISNADVLTMKVPRDFDLSAAMTHISILRWIEISKTLDISCLSSFRSEVGVLQFLSRRLSQMLKEEPSRPLVNLLSESSLDDHDVAPLPSIIDQSS